MERSWKRFTIIISAMLCAIIVLTTVNVALDKVTSQIDPSTNTSDTNRQGDQNSQNDQSGTQNTAGGVTTNANGQVVTQPNGTATAVTPNGSTGSSTSGGTSVQPQASTVLGYNKNQIVAYYNTCLKSSYAQAKMTDKKTEQVTIGVDSVTINGGENNSTITKVANSIASKNQKQTEESKSFSSGKASDGTSASTYVLPTNLTSAGVKSASISKSGNGYKVVITLVSETCGHTSKPPYNASCAWPLDINEVVGALDGFAKITQAQFAYPGTMLTATIDANGRVSYVRVDMPLTVTNGTGEVTYNFPGLKGMVITASAHGKWVCTHTMSF